MRLASENREEDSSTRYPVRQFEIDDAVEGTFHELIQPLAMNSTQNVLKSNEITRPVLFRPDSGFEEFNERPLAQEMQVRNLSYIRLKVLEIPICELSISSIRSFPG